MAAKREWYHRWQDRARPAPRADHAGGRQAESTSLAGDYLLQSLRTNAPGYADQDAFAMSRAFLGTTYLAVNTKATQASQAEIKLFEEDDSGEPENRVPLSRYEDASQLIHNPNPDDSFGEIVEQLSLQWDLTGTAPLWVPHDVTDPHDTPTEMYVLSTASLLPQPISPDYPHGAYLVQPWYPAGPYAMLPVSQGVGAVVPAEQIIRIKKPHPFFRWIGYSTLFAVSMQQDAARQIDVARMNHFSQGFDPSAILTFDPSVKQPDEAAIRRLEAQLQAVWQGPRNAGRIVVAPGGAEIKPFSTTPAEMAYHEGWTQLLDFGLAAFGINRAVAGMTDGLTYATLFASLRAFYLMTLNPFLRKVSDKITRHVLRPFFDRSFCLELTGESITDEDLDLKKVSSALQGGLAKVGELRKMLGLPKSERDDQWAGQGAPAPSGPGAAPAPGAAAAEPGDPDARAMQRQRPDNPQGEGTLGPRGLPTDRREQLGKALEKALSNGHAKQVRA